MTRCPMSCSPHNARQNRRAAKHGRGDCQRDTNKSLLQQPAIERLGLSGAGRKAGDVSIGDGHERDSVIGERAVKLSEKSGAQKREKEVRERGEMDVDDAGEIVTSHGTHFNHRTTASTASA